jgi:integrase
MAVVVNPATNKPIMTDRWGVRIIDCYGKRKRVMLPYRGNSGKDAQKQADMLENREREIALGLRASPAVPNAAAGKKIAEALSEHIEWGKFEGGRGGFPWSATHAHDRESNMKWWIHELGLDAVVDLETILPDVERALQTLAKTGRSHLKAPSRVRQKPLSRKTIRETAAHLKAFCNWCIDRGYLRKNPLEARRTRREVKIQPEVMRRESTVEELKALLEAAPPYLRMLILTALLTGFRRGELRSLTLGHLDAATMTLRIDASHDKTRKLRYQAIPSHLFQLLLDYAASGEPKRLYARHNQGTKNLKLGIPEEPLLFVPTHAARTLDRVARRAGLAKVTGKGKLDFHSLRTSFINLLLEMGVDPKTVQGLARHGSIGMTMDTYTDFL